MLGVAINYKEADININLDTTNSLYHVTMGIRSCLNSRKDDTDHHIVKDGALEGGSAVLSEANLPGVATEHCEIGARDDEKAAVCNGLGRDVQKRGGGAVRIQFDGFEALIPGARKNHELHTGVVVGLDLGLGVDPILQDVGSGAVDGVGVEVVGGDVTYGGHLVEVAYGAQPRLRHVGVSKAESQ